MPCRPQLCQRLAIQLSTATSGPNGSGIWITDDVLADAFNRYVRVSKVVKRHGSNVPGPLEAHRRLAKRRMGLASAAANGAPPPSDFGQLFGPGGSAPTDTGWKWQAPGVPLGPQPPPPPTDWRPWMKSKPPITSLERRPPPHIAPPEPSIQAAQDPVTASKAAFRALLEPLFNRQTIDDTALMPILDFLQSSADEILAQNTLRLTRWLVSHQCSEAALEQLVLLISDKVQLDTLLDNDIEQIIKLLPQLPMSTQLPSRRVQYACESTWHALEIRFSKKGRVMASLGTYEALVNSVDRFAKVEDSFANGRALDLMLEILERAVPVKVHEDVMAMARMMASLVRRASRLEKSMAAEMDALCTRLSAILGSLPSAHAATVLANTTRRLLQEDFTEASVPGQLQCVALFWLRCLRVCKLLQHEPASSGIWGNLYVHLAKVFKPVSLAEHFKGMTSLDLSRILLQYWAPEQVANDEYSVFSRSSYQTISASRHETLGEHSRKLYEDFEALRVSRQPMVAMLLALARNRLRYAALTHEVLSVLMRIRSLGRVYILFAQLCRHPEIGVPTTTAADLVNYFLAKRDRRRALLVFNSIPTIPLSTCPNLPLSLVEANLATPQVLFPILLRQTSFDTIPSPQRTIHRLAIRQHVVGIVHLVADALARSPAINCRVAFRRVWMSYRFLQDRGAPMTPLMSRAFVWAGVVRPLRERGKVTTVMFTYILNIVRRLEGEEVAQQLDRLVWVIKGDVHAEKARARRLGELETPKTGNEGTIKQVVRWRAKGWTKKQSVRSINEQGREVWCIDRTRDAEGATKAERNNTRSRSGCGDMLFRPMIAEEDAASRDDARTEAGWHAAAPIPFSMEQPLNRPSNAQALNAVTGALGPVLEKTVADPTHARLYGGPDSMPLEDDTSETFASALGSTGYCRRLGERELAALEEKFGQADKEPMAVPSPPVGLVRTYGSRRTYARRYRADEEQMAAPGPPVGLLHRYASRYQADAPSPPVGLVRTYASCYQADEEPMTAPSPPVGLVRKYASRYQADEEPMAAPSPPVALVRTYTSRYQALALGRRWGQMRTPTESDSAVAKGAEKIHNEPRCPGLAQRGCEHGGRGLLDIRILPFNR